MSAIPPLLCLLNRNTIHSLASSGFFPHSTIEKLWELGIWRFLVIRLFFFVLSQLHFFFLNLPHNNNFSPQPPHNDNLSSSTTISTTTITFFRGCFSNLFLQTTQSQLPSSSSTSFATSKQLEVSTINHPSLQIDTHKHHTPKPTIQIHPPLTWSWLSSLFASLQQLYVFLLCLTSTNSTSFSNRLDTDTNYFHHYVTKFHCY